MRIESFAIFAVYLQAIEANSSPYRHLRGKRAVTDRNTKKISRHLKKGQVEKWDDTKVHHEKDQLATQPDIPLGSNGLPNCNPPNCYTQIQKDMLKDATDKAKEQALTKGHVDRFGGAGTMEVIDSFDVTTNEKQMHFTVYVVTPGDDQEADKPVEPNRAPAGESIDADTITRLPYHEQNENDKPVPGTEHVDLVLDKAVPGSMKKPEAGSEILMGSPTGGDGLPAHQYNRVQPAGDIARCSIQTWNLSGNGKGHECNHDYDCAEGCCAVTNHILGSKKCVPPDVNPSFNLVCQDDVGNECKSSTANRAGSGYDTFGRTNGTDGGCVTPKIPSAEDYSSVENFHRWRNCYKPCDCESGICAVNPPGISKGICVDAVPAGWRLKSGDI